VQFVTVLVTVLEHCTGDEPDDGLLCIVDHGCVDDNDLCHHGKLQLLLGGHPG